MIMHWFEQQFERFETLVPAALLGQSTTGKQRSLLRLLAVGHREGLDPTVLVRNLAAEHPGRYSRKLQNVERWMAAGSSLVVALAQTPGALNAQDTLTIQCGIEAGLVEETFESLLERCEREEWTLRSNSMFATVGYIFGVLMLLLLIVLFLSVAIIPMFIEIFDEFGLVQPLAMTLLVDVTSEFSVLIPLVFLGVIAFGFSLLSESFGRRLHESAISRFWMPAVEQQRAGLLQLLALPTRCGRGVLPTVTAVAQYHPNPRWRKRFLRARTNSDSEAAIWYRLATEGLISSDQAEQLLKVDTPRLRGWALDTLAEQKHQRAISRMRWWRDNLQVIPIVLVGLFVGWVAVAVMQTLTHLIHSLA